MATIFFKNNIFSNKILKSLVFDNSRKRRRNYWIIDLVFFSKLSRAVTMRMKKKSSLVVFWTDPSCGGVFYLTNRGVEVTSPNYPDLHPPDITCQYVFKVSKLLNLVTPEHVCQLYFKGAVNNSCLQNIFAF